MSDAGLVADVFDHHWPTLVAVLRRELGDEAQAEDAAADAIAAAWATWPDRPPRNPGAWLLTTARRRAIDSARRAQRYQQRLDELARRPVTAPRHEFVDDQLALIFGCAHPALAESAQVALTLREVCGLTTAQIASAFLVSEAAMAKRLVRAKHKIRSAGVPFSVPGPQRLAERLDSVLACIYLIFNEGCTARERDGSARANLVGEAAWLASLVHRLLPDEPEAQGLVALIGFVDARRSTRIDNDGRVVLLENQDRSAWDHALIASSDAALTRALRTGRVGPYQLQAAIAGVHAHASSLDDTDWDEIIALYGLLARCSPSPVVQLNRAVAVAQRHGPTAGLTALEPLEGPLAGYAYYWTTKARLHEDLGDITAARRLFRRAAECVTTDEHRQFVAERLAAIDSPDPPLERQSTGSTPHDGRRAP